MTVLGIETSCDETSAAVVRDGRVLLSNVVASSIDLHKAYGGVVPEIAARSHIEVITPVIEKALIDAFSGRKSKVKSPKQDDVLSDHWEQIDAIAVTYGAGLGGSLLVGVISARTLAIARSKPLYAVNHVEGHVYANFLTDVGEPKAKDLKSKGGVIDYRIPTKQPEFPMLALIVSGGHTQLVLFRDHFDYTLLGKTRDDAVGEAFDKVAKIIGLPYPGGPSVSKKALEGDAFKYDLPKAKLTPLPHTSKLTPHASKYDFSFSGLKTAVLRLAQSEIGENFTFPSFKVAERLSETQKADIAASFQRVAIETLVDKTIDAYEEYAPRSVVIAGGVAANQELRAQLRAALGSMVEGQSSKVDDILRFTDIKLCTDNGAMIATLGCYISMHGKPTADPYSLQINPNLSM